MRDAKTAHQPAADAAAVPHERRLRVNGIELTIFEWGIGFKERGDPVVLAHATGFHARCWDRMIPLLGARRVVAIDARGHGRSEKTFPVRWAEFGRDMAGVVDALDLHNVVGVGHSMGGHAMVEAAAARPKRFRRLVLIDPVIGAPEEYADGERLTERLRGMQHPTAKRRNHWASADEMFERFKDRPPFASFDRGVLRDYCDYGLLPNPEGRGLVLACPPAFEAAVYMASRGNRGIYDSVRAVTVPVLVVRAMEAPRERGMMDFRYSPTFPGLVRHFPRAREIYLPERTHFLPLEDPPLVARYIVDGA